MKTALVCAGGVGRSFVARMPSLLHSVGPVKASSLRVSRRIANALRAGRAVDAYSALDGSDLIWIAVPEDALERVTREVASEVAISETMIVLCATPRDSFWPAWLQARGARVATLDAIELGEHTLVAEGHAAVVRELRRVAAAERRRLVEVRPDAKASYLAGVRLAENLAMPYFAAAVESLRAGGLSRKEAARVVETLGTQALRAYGKAGRKAWNRVTALDLRESLLRDIDSIQSVDPALAELYRDGIEQALRYFED